MNQSLPLTCIRNNMMCIKTPILLLYKNQHGIWEFRYFPQTFRIVGGWPVTRNVHISKGTHVNQIKLPTYRNGSAT